jgi:hypothetical protein
MWRLKRADPMKAKGRIVITRAWGGWGSRWNEERPAHPKLPLGR